MNKKLRWIIDGIVIVVALVFLLFALASVANAASPPVSPILTPPASPISVDDLSPVVVMNADTHVSPEPLILTGFVLLVLLILSLPFSIL